MQYDADCVPSKALQRSPLQHSLTCPHYPYFVHYSCPYSLSYSLPSCSPSLCCDLPILPTVYKFAEFGKLRLGYRGLYIFPRCRAHSKKVPKTSASSVITLNACSASDGLPKKPIVSGALGPPGKRAVRTVIACTVYDWLPKYPRYLHLFLP